MTELGPAPPAPSTPELIAALGKHIMKVMKTEHAEEWEVDRFWILRKVFKAYLYYRDLAYFAPALFQGLVDATGIDGSMIPNGDSNAAVYDYTQNVYKGYCRKLVAILGTRIPNAIAIPNDPSSEKDQAAARAANDAAQYIRQSCDLQVLVLWCVFKLFNFGTTFWSVEWVEDADKNGWKEIAPDPGQEPLTLGQDDPDLGGGFSVDAPATAIPKRVPKGALEIDILDAAEISVPLDANGRLGVKDCDWIRRDRELPKARLLRKWPELRQSQGADEAPSEDSSSAGTYAENVRSAFASPIGIIRPKRETRWTLTTEDWTPNMYELVDDQSARQMLQENFPDGLRATMVKGRIVDLEARKLTDHWQECQPEPTERIMADPLGDDWIVTQDLLNNTLNQENETVERSNEPGFADPTRVDLDAWQRRRDSPGDLIPAIPPAGRSLPDIIYRPPQLEFSEQIPAFRQQVEATSQDNSGLTPAIWGGQATDPTARQTELRTNAAIRQLGVPWVMIGKSVEQLFTKGCRLLAENEDGILSFSKKNQFGKFDSVAVVMEDLRGGEYHFEADEAIPMTWGQQRDLLMWMLDKPQPILQAFGLEDPLNIFEIKQLMGMPGMRTPHLDDRDKGMKVIGKLLEGQPQPGAPGPDGSPGQLQPSISPDWEDDSAFMANLVKAYLTVNSDLQEANPTGYQNVVLWGQAHEQKANQPPPAAPPKTSVTVALKGEDIGPAATSAIISGDGIAPPGTQAQPTPVPKVLPVDPQTGAPQPRPIGMNSNIPNS